MFDEDVNNLMSSIYFIAAHNLNLNGYGIESIEDSLMYAGDYLKEFSSAIARDINCVEDKEQLLEALESDLIENAWISRVLLHYRDEVKRHVKLEKEVSIKELFHEAPQPKTDAKPVYKFEAKNS